MRARSLKWSNGTTRLPSVLARLSFVGEGSLGTRLVESSISAWFLLYLEQEESYMAVPDMENQHHSVCILFECLA